MEKVPETFKKNAFSVCAAKTSTKENAFKKEKPKFFLKIFGIFI